MIHIFFRWEEWSRTQQAYIRCLVCASSISCRAIWEVEWRERVFFWQRKVWCHCKFQHHTGDQVKLQVTSEITSEITSDKWNYKWNYKWQVKLQVKLQVTSEITSEITSDKWNYKWQVKLQVKLQVTSEITSVILIWANRPFAQLLPGLETGHPVTVGQSPAYDFSVSDEQKAVFLVSFSDCSECDSYAGDWPTVTGCPVSNPGNNCANSLFALLVMEFMRISHVQRFLVFQCMHWTWPLLRLFDEWLKYRHGCLMWHYLQETLSNGKNALVHCVKKKHYCYYCSPEEAKLAKRRGKKKLPTLLLCDADWEQQLVILISSTYQYCTVV